MADDIVTRLRYAARTCDHGFPNGAGDSFPDPTFCGGCLRLNDAADEIERLRRWQSEAIGVIDNWEAAWVAAGTPGVLGQSKALSLLGELNRLTDEIERLRAAGDALFNYLHDHPGSEIVRAAWQEARRG